MCGQCAANACVAGVCVCASDRGAPGPRRRTTGRRPPLREKHRITSFPASRPPCLPACAPLAPRPLSRLSALSASLPPSLCPPTPIILSPPPRLPVSMLPTESTWASNASSPLEHASTRTPRLDLSALPKRPASNPTPLALTVSHCPFAIYSMDHSACEQPFRKRAVGSRLGAPLQ